MFAVHVGNPFTSGSRREERDKKLMETHREERAQRDATRQAAWDSSNRAQQAGQQTKGIGGGGLPKATLADRAKYQFEADSEDDEMVRRNLVLPFPHPFDVGLTLLLQENEIDNNLDQLHGAAKRTSQPCSPLPLSLSLSISLRYLLPFHLSILHF